MSEGISYRQIDLNNTACTSGDTALAIDAIDHLELYSANARQTAFFFQNALGFIPLAYKGPENWKPAIGKGGSGKRDTVCYVLRQHEITLLISGALVPEHPISNATARHGDFVKSIAFKVSDCSGFYKEALHRGAESAEPPSETTDKHGSLITAAIKTYGDTIHRLVQRSNYSGLFWPGFDAYESFFQVPKPAGDAGLIAIDHVVGNVELGKMDYWVGFYEKVLGFKQMLHFSDEQISTEYSSLMSKVMSSGTGKIKFPINEPAQGKRKSQIEEYLDFNCGPGVQHVAFRTLDIVRSVEFLKDRGVNFLRVPAAYYDEVPKRVGQINEDLERLARLGVLVDRDDDGYLLQLFTKPILDRPTLFFEMIQREGSQGFGVGNFKALFEAIEREQALRGNL